MYTITYSLVENNCKSDSFYRELSALPSIKRADILVLFSCSLRTLLQT